jgi:glutamyl-tRNA synthetase
MAPSIYPEGMPPTAGTTRLAPSPTGPLHLGHACSFLAAWVLARRQGWRILLRMDDLDAPRVRSSGHDTLETLRWLGIEWDGDPIRQSSRLERHRAALERLAESGVIFASPQSRQEVREAAAAVGAPHEGDSHVAFPASLRPPPGPAWGFTDQAVNHRIRVDPGPVQVRDELLGLRVFDPAAQHGDFLVWTKAGVPSYQLACAVDDAELGVTDVVRGEDLLESAALQTLLLRRMGFAPPRWWHLPLVRDAEGRRLAKRDGAEGLDSLRRSGVSAERVRGLAAWWLGLAPREPISAESLLAHASIEGLRRGAGEHAAPRVDAAALAWLHGSKVSTDTLASNAGRRAVE